MPRKLKKAKRKVKATLSVYARHPVIQVDKRFLRLLDTKKKVVYFIRGNKPIQYDPDFSGRRSRILYIGQTKRAGRRPLTSIMENAPELLEIHGVKSLDCVYVEAPPHKRVDIGPKLEKAFLHEFRAYFGKVPKANVRGSKRLEITDEWRYVNKAKVDKTILQLSH